MHTLFVYGTLRKKSSNSWLLNNSQFIGFDCISGFIMLDFGDYPMIFESAEENTIIVENYLVDDYTLEQIDRFEEYHGEGSADNLYTRKTVESLTGSRGFIYTGVNNNQCSNASVIISGDWLRKYEKKI